MGACLLTGCALKPAVQREKTMMTPAQIADAGLECRTMTQVGTNIPKTFCATNETWAVYDERTRASTEDLFEIAGAIPNVGRFNRD